ncbi:hypothetical protein BH23CHL4_BH23CHL4_22990 [soil metagenome]
MLDAMVKAKRKPAPQSERDDTVPIRQPRRTREHPAAVDRTPLLTPFLFPLFVWAVHFVIVNASAYVAYRYGESNAPSPPLQTVPPELDGWAAHVVEPLRLWDGLWYRLIAIEGYDYHDANAAFWPVLPVSMRWIEQITGLAPEVGGYIIANASFAVALMLLYRLIAMDFDPRIAKRALWALALFPTALFFSAVYTESVFLMFAAGALLSARIRRWWLAGTLGLLAALTRSYGVFLALPFAVLFIRQYGLYLRELFPRAIAVAMPALGPLIFGLHLERTQGSWRQFIDVQSQWNRTFAWPWETFRCAVEGCTLTVTNKTRTGTEGPWTSRTTTWPVEKADWSWIDQLLDNPSWTLISSASFRRDFANSDTLELIATVTFLILAVIGLKVLPLYQSAYLIPGLVIPLFSPSTVHPLMSMPRFGLTMFPLFVVIALLLRWRWLRLPVFAASTVLLILLTMQFANWYWVS